MSNTPKWEDTVETPPKWEETEELPGKREETPEAPVPEPSMKENVQSAVANFGKSAPFIGLADKVASAGEAAAQEVGDLFRDEKDQRDFSDRYSENVKFYHDDREEKAAKGSGIAKGVGTAAGIGANLAVPTPGSKAAGIMAMLSRLAGTAGMAGAEAATSNPNKLIDVDAAKQAMKTGALMSGGVELLGGARKLYKGAQKGMENAAGDMAVRAAIGRNKKLLQEMGEDTTEMGKQLLKKDEAGGKVVGWFSGPQKMHERLEAKKGFYGRQIGEIGDAVEEAGERVSKDDIANAIDEWSKKKIPEIEVRKPSPDPDDLPGVDDVVTKKVLSHQKSAKDALAAQADDYRSMSQSPTFNEAQTLKGTYKWTSLPGETHVLPGDAQNTIKKAIGKAQENAADAAGLGNKYRDVKKGYGTYDTLAEGAENRVAQDRTNSLLGLYAPMAGGAVFGGATGNTMGDRVQNALIGGVAARYAKTRGASTAANAMNSIAKVMALGGKFGKVLEAANKRGSLALMATHQALLNDPEYQALLNEQE